MSWNLDALCIPLTLPIEQAIHQMAAVSGQGGPSGIVVVVDNLGAVVGVVTDGDVRRAYVKGIPFSHSVAEIMSSDPVAVPPGLPRREILRRAVEQARAKSRFRDLRINKVLVLDACGHLVNILNLLELSLDGEVRTKRVAVYGMGYVGLTLALSLANVGFRVTGVDIKAQAVADLLAGVPPVYEPGLQELLDNHLKLGDIQFTTGLSQPDHDIYIVAVGTPVDGDNKPQLFMIEAVARQLGQLIKRGDLIALRSTVPVGTTRECFIPLVEETSGLVGGEDFQVVFAPERTIEGNALQELRTLPQVIGGLTEYCVEEASRFWSTLTPSLVRVQSLEAAELVKLANNTFRDLSFAFANEMAWLCEQYNIDAFGLIQAANEGYPRNPIPRPSPGVGGYCLTKDPYIYTSPLKGNYQPLLGEVSRRVNGLAPQRVIGYIERFIETQGLDWSQLTILIAGFAFKGIPDTSDLRGSVTLDILALLPDNLREVRAFDAAVPLAKLAALAVTPVTTLEIGLAGADVVLFLNNHPQHTRFNLYSGLSQMRKPALLFDGWHQLNELEVLQIPGMTYATLGYQNHR